MDKVNRNMKFIYSFLIAYVSLIPFYYFPANYFFGFKFPIVKYIPFLLILSLFSISFLKGLLNIKAICREKLNIYILVYLVLTFLSGLATDYYLISVLKALYYGASGILIYLIIYSWKLDINMKVYFLKKIVIIAFLVSIYGIITLILKKDLFFGGLQYSQSNLMHPKIFLEIGRISSTLGNPLFLGCFLSAIFPISLYLQLLSYEQKVFPKYLAEIISVVIFIGILLTFSVGAFFSVIIFSIFYFINMKKSDKRVMVFFGAVLLCLVLLMLMANILLESQNKDYLFGGYFQRFDFRKLSNMGAVSMRLDSLRCVFDFLKTKDCFLGVGIGRIGAGGNLFSRVSMDNYLCLLLIESGFLAVILISIIFYLIIKKTYNKEKRLNIFIISSLIIFFVNMFFWDVLNQPTMRILFWSFVGFLV